jgi:hypothetical protein
MPRTVMILLGVALLLLAVAGPAAAHNLEVDPSGQGPTTQRWVGGGPLNENAIGQGLVVNPFGDILPPSHFVGLPAACRATNANPSAVTFQPPPFGTGCQHGGAP